MMKLYSFVYILDLGAFQRSIMNANLCEAGYFCDFGSLEATPRDVSGSFKYCREGHYCDEGTESEGDNIF